MTLKKTNQEKILSYAGKGALGLLVVLVCGFVGMKLYPLVHGPDVLLSTFKDGANLDNPMVSVSGKALYTKNLMVNGNPLALSPDGSFSETIVLNPGYNVVSLQAKDQFGKVSTHDYALMLSDTPGTPNLTMNTTPVRP